MQKRVLTLWIRLFINQRRVSTDQEVVKGDELRKLMLIMHRKILVETLISGLRDYNEFEFIAEYDYNEAQTAVCVNQPEIILLEIPESGAVTSKDCLTFCDAVKEKNRSCKIMLLCPERNADACICTEQALHDKRIDDFVYYDTSMRYLVSKLRAL